MPVPAPVLGACVSAAAGAVVVWCCFCRCYRHCGCCHCHCRCCCYCYCFFLFFALSLLSHAVAVGVLSAGHHRLFHSFSLLTQQLTPALHNERVTMSSTLLLVGPLWRLSCCGQNGGTSTPSSSSPFRAVSFLPATRPRTSRSWGSRSHRQSPFQSPRLCEEREPIKTSLLRLKCIDVRGGWVNGIGWTRKRGGCLTR
jgi:hypothetical protein